MKPRIVLLSAFVSPYRSGAEACAEEVAARLQDRFDIVIVAARMRRDLPHSDTLPSGVRVVRIGIGASIDKWLYPFLAPIVVGRIRPRVVHAVLESFAGLALVGCCVTVPRARRILTCQSTNTSLFLGLMHRSAHGVTAISSVLTERAKRWGIDAVLIPNGIRAQELRSVHAVRVPGRILFVGRLEPMKGVDTLLQAFAVMVRGAHLLASHHASAAHIRIVGDGSERGRLERIATKLGIADRVTFVGGIPHDQVAQEYAQAQIFCGLSRSEALGNVFLEAQAAGCTVVATRVGGIPDIVHDGETGLLVMPDDPDAAAAAVERLLTDESLRQRMAEAGMHNAVRYDWDGIAERYGQIYDAVTA